MKTKRLVIAGGGTGGHLYPAIAIARALQKKAPEWDIQFVGAAGGLEEKIVPRENFVLHLLPIGRLNRNIGWRGQLHTLLGLPWAAMQTLLLLWRLRPTVVLGVGGFASGPFLLASALSGIPAALWEPNAYPGLTNRWLAPFMTKCLVVFKEAQRFMRSRQFVQVGLPVRSSMRPANATELHHDNKFHLLVFGGSQGARAINHVVASALQEGGDWLKEIAVVQQTGPADFNTVKQTATQVQADWQVFDFLHDMQERYHWADLVVCRSGASTVAEICACRKAAIFIPLPTAADNHQQKNAEVLAHAGAAEMVLQRDFTPASLKKMVEQYKSNPSRLQSMIEKLDQFQFPHAAERIADELLGMAK
jgi:UDP-N-acetylglucosamine--N-acetylmuramyl-(pentapeptide) pyrophosphoryl-undecaprenol N-acetylglucosamine transferase